MLSTSSCADDKESSKVTAIREAYTNQLKAQGALAEAQSEATKLKIEAEIALLNAQTEQTKAQIKLDEANAALIAAQTENEKLKAEQQKSLADEELKRLQAKIQVELAEYKIKLEQMQISAEIQMLNLQQELDKAKNQKDQVLDDAINAYKILASDINTLKNNIAMNELDLAYNKSVLEMMKTSESASASESIRQHNYWISSAETRITNNELSLQGWNLLVKDIDFTKIQTQIAEKTKEYQALLVKRTSVYNDYNTQYKIFEAGAKKDLTDFQSLVGNYYTYQPMPNNMVYYTFTEIENNITSSVNQLNTYEASLKEYTVNLAAYKAKNESLLQTKKEKEAIKDEAYLAYDRARNDYYSDYSNEHWNKYQEASRVYDNASNAYYAANNAYSENQNNISNAEYQISSLNSSIVYQKQYVDKYTAQKAAYGGDADKPQKLAEAYTKAEKVYMPYLTAYNDLNEEIRVMGNDLAELNKIYYSNELHGSQWSTGITSGSLEYVQNIIKELENDIASDKERVARYKRDITNISELNKKTLAELDLRIETTDAEIKRMKTELQIAEIQAAAAKKVIDERMK